MSPATILCVDDHEPALALLKFLLEAKGYEVILTTSPAKALIVVTTGRDIQLVITDFTMPVMSGGELIQEIRRWRPEMPIILFTGASNICGVRGVGENVCLPKGAAAPKVLLAYIQKLINKGKDYGKQEPNRNQAIARRAGSMSAGNPRLLQNHRSN